MKLMKTPLLLALLLLCGLLFPLLPKPAGNNHLARAAVNPRFPQDTTYAARGDRSEGIKLQPVSSSFTLISVLALPVEKFGSVPDQLKIKFYLQNSSPVFVTVREIGEGKGYWLDKVKAQNWGPGFGNNFAWSTRDVIQKVREINLNNLGVLVRLDREQPSRIEHVAPAIFYATAIPSTISGYAFNFKLGRAAKVTYNFYKDGAVVGQEKVQRVPPVLPFTIRWPTQNIAEGSCRLVLKAVFLDNSETVEKTVEFYHKPAVPK